MEELTLDMTHLLQSLIDSSPVLGAMVLLVIVFLIYLHNKDKHTAKRDDLLIGIIKENSISSTELKDSIEHLIDFCHRGRRKELEEEDNGT